MRDELREIERPRRPERATGEDVAERARDRAHLAAVLVLGLRGRLLDRDRLRLVDGATPHLLHEVREAEVVPELRVVLDVRLALHRVDRAVARRDRARGRLLLAHPHLVAPVGALHVRAVRALEPELAADVADLVVGEVADERAQRVRLPLAVRVGEREHVARRLANRSVLRRDLALTRALQKADARVLGGDLPDDRVREVGRAVGGDDDLERSRPDSRARARSRRGGGSPTPRRAPRRRARPTASASALRTGRGRMRASTPIASG